jgi:hypothetical protein
MKGRVPKDPKIRQRTNKSVTRAVFYTDAAPARAPLLPRDRQWHNLTKRWWREVWASPMAGEFLKVDLNSLFILAVLIDRFWNEPSKNLAAEIRLQQQAFGLTPLDRRRLEWQVIQTEEAKDKADIKRSRRAKIIDDPRGVLE